MGNVGGGGGGEEPGQAGQLHTVAERYFVLKVSHTLRLACTCTHTYTHACTQPYICTCSSIQ